eukprot:255655-Rhodomonas_salina.2
MSTPSSSTPAPSGPTTSFLLVSPLRCPCVLARARARTNPRAQSLPLSFTRSLAHSVPRSATHSLNSLTRSLTPALPPSLPPTHPHQRLCRPIGFWRDHTGYLTF